MTPSHIQFEAKKHTLRQNQDGLVNVTFSIHPQEADINRLMMDPMGTRYTVVLVDMDSIEQKGSIAVEGKGTGDMHVPINEPQSPVINKLVQQAAMICQDSMFKRYIFAKNGTNVNSEEDNSYVLREMCGVTSRKEIIEGTEAGERFKAIQRDFNQFKRDGTVAA